MGSQVAVLALLLCHLALPSASAPQTRPDLSKLQSILKLKAIQWNTSFSIGVFSDSFGSFGAAGYIDGPPARCPVVVLGRAALALARPWTRASSLLLQWIE
jgi:hypothetical protein